MNKIAKGGAQQTQDIEPTLGQCGPAVYDVGPTLTQRRFNVSCLMGDVD